MNYSQPVSADTFISLWMYKTLQETATIKFCPSSFTPKFWQEMDLHK